jgi:hypothetical protein
VEACWAHNPEVRGSKPRSAIIFLHFKHFCISVLTKLIVDKKHSSFFTKGNKYAYTHPPIHPHTHIHTYLYTYISLAKLIINGKRSSFFAKGLNTYIFLAKLIMDRKWSSFFAKGNNTYTHTHTHTHTHTCIFSKINH